MTEFLEFPKIGRWSREIIVTEKIDGTNAQIYIEALEGYPSDDPQCVYQADGLAMWAGSRNRWITPANDNYGFASWVVKNADELLKLGPGRHFGEWWGQGIQRKYGLSEKRFSMFNVERWCPNGKTPRVIPALNPKDKPKTQDILPGCVGLVPTLYRGMMDEGGINQCLSYLRDFGSLAAPGFMDAEGIVIYHTASGVGFKKTLKNDETPKSLAGSRG
jgi:hypothetical protein